MRLQRPGGWGLGGKLLLALAAVLGVATLASIGVFFQLYRHELTAESRLAARRATEVAAIAVEAATAANDPSVLRAAVERLGAIEGLAAVSLLGPDLETRAGAAAAGSRPASLAALCADCGRDEGTPGLGTGFVQDAGGRTLLRTVMAISGGFLVLDHDPAVLRQRARRTAAVVSFGAGLITLLALAATWFALRHLVLRPVARLHAAAQGIAAGDLHARVPNGPDGGDEMAALGGTFNRMAERLDASMTALRERDDFLQGVMDAVPDGIRVIADDYAVVAANRNFARQVGLTPREIIGRPCYAVSHGRSEPCVPTLVTCPVAELATGPGPVKCTHVHRRGEEEFAVEVVAARLAVPGAPRRHIVEAIREVSQEVEITLGQRLSEIGQLATGVAHEIHNPLSSIQLALAAVREKVTPQMPGRSGIDPYLDIVDREINRCIDVTGRLLRLSEPGGNNATLVDIGDVIRDVLSLVGCQATQGAVRIHQEIEGPLRSLGSDSDFGILILNLVQNALHAMPAGGELTIRAHEQQGSISIAVADTGIGISAEDLQRIFWPFWSKRADGTRGAGLGLAICKSTVEQLGGRIEVQSTPGQGSCFTIVVPALSPPRSTQ